jgi:hypothetical protein
MGSYGGFAGAMKSYIFMPNGQRFMSSSILGSDASTNANEIEKLKTADFKTMLKSLKKMDFNKLELNEVGNMTYFVTLKNKKSEKKIQWSNMDTAPKELVEFYHTSLKNINTAAIN